MKTWLEEKVELDTILFDPSSLIFCWANLSVRIYCPVSFLKLFFTKILSFLKFSEPLIAMSAERYLQTVDLYREGKHACMEIEDLEVSWHVQCIYSKASSVMGSHLDVRYLLLHLQVMLNLKLKIGVMHTCLYGSEIPEVACMSVWGSSECYISNVQY